jgi:hypothetical protein
LRSSLLTSAGKAVDKMSAALDTLRQAQAPLADTSTEAHQLVAKAIEQLGEEAERREDRIDRERVRLTRVGEVLKCLAVALDEEADVVASDVRHGSMLT